MLGYEIFVDDENNKHKTMLTLLEYFKNAGCWKIVRDNPHETTIIVGEWGSVIDGNSSVVRAMEVFKNVPKQNIYKLTHRANCIDIEMKE